MIKHLTVLYDRVTLSLTLLQIVYVFVLWNLLGSNRLLGWLIHIHQVWILLHLGWLLLSNLNQVLIRACGQMLLRKLILHVLCGMIRTHICTKWHTEGCGIDLSVGMTTHDSRMLIWLGHLTLNRAHFIHFLVIDNWLTEITVLRPVNSWLELHLVVLLSRTLGLLYIWNQILMRHHSGR